MKLFSMFAVVALVLSPAGLFAGEKVGTKEKMGDKEVSAEVYGVWGIEYSMDGTDHKSTTIFGKSHGQLVAWNVIEGELESFTKVEIKDDTIHMSIEPKELGGLVTVELESRITEPNVCTGKATYVTANGDTGEFDYVGKKAGLDDFEEVSSWELDFTTPDGIHREPTLTVVKHEGTYYAWYSSEDFELPILDMTVENEKVVMKMTSQTAEGDKVEFVFRGELDDESISGKADWEMGNDAGSFEFSGKLKQ